MIAMTGHDSVILQASCMLVSRGTWARADVTVMPRRVECVTRTRAIVHRGPEIVVVRARLLPWPGAAAIILVNEDGRRACLWPVSNLARIVTALAHAGFLLSERRALAALG